MMRLILIFLAALLPAFVHAADPKYPVSAIPEALKKNVNAVIREDEEVFTIVSKDKATYYVHKVITILNDKAKELASEVVGYDKLTKIKDFNGSVYDVNGKLIKKLKNSEIYDQSAVDGVSLYSDARLKAVNLEQGSYPYTVEFEYELEYKFLFHIPGFYVVPDEKISVQNCSYKLVYPFELAPRYKLHNIIQAPQKTKDTQYESLKWSFENFEPIKFEPHGPSNIIPYILAAPSKFQYDSYEGDMSTWDAFGQWINSLNRGRDNLPQSTIVKVKELTSNLQTREEKVKALYEYLQSKTRYVGIQLGIGGFQPFDALVVDQTGYGDCKALSNYMVSMLKVVGIKSHYVLIKAGETATPMKTDFPSSQFNHAIVAVPNDADTLWLECTSQSNPFGYAGSFTGDRKALLITDNGAVAVNTPSYNAQQNLQSRSAEVTIDITGNAKAKVTTSYQGIQYENGGLYGILNNQFDEQKKWIQKNTSIPTFDINSFSVKNNKHKIPSAVVQVDLTLNRLANVSGKRIFLTPNLMNRNNYIPEKVETRKTTVVRRLTYTDIDTIKYKLPEEIYPEFLPEPIKIKNRFGEYEVNFQIDQGSLIYIRKVKMEKGEFPAESYQELIDFYRNITKADNTKLVFMSKT